MAVPKKKEIRKIIVNDIGYYWKYLTKDEYGRIIIGKTEHSNTFIKVDFLSKNRWGFVDSKENNIEIITPKFVRQSIEFALKNTRGFDAKNFVILGYQDSEFYIIRN